MEIGFISIDTNVLERARFNFDSGILNQLRQFEKSKVRLIFSEIVIEESKLHILKDFEENLEKCRSSLEKLKRKKNLEESIFSEIKRLLDLNGNAIEIVSARLEKFMNDTNAELVPSSLANLNQIVSDFFNEEPPFEKRSDKKHEFPDSIALRSIEQWASKNEIKGYIVSHDQGWKRFAETSKYLIHQQDLPKVLQEVSQIDSNHIRRVKEFITQILSRKSEPDYDFIRSGLEEQIDELEPDFNLTTGFHHHSIDYYQIELLGFEQQLEGDELESYIVNKSRNYFTIDLPIWLSIKVVCDVELFFWDSIDKDEVSAGSSEISKNEEIEASILIEIEEDEQKNLRVSNIELSTSLVEIDLGDLDISDHLM